MMTNEIRDATTGDIYVDQSGKLWRVVGRYDEPVVCVKAIEGDQTETQGGISGCMWEGWKRIHRPE